jgi:hypothetical protein
MPPSTMNPKNAMLKRRLRRHGLPDLPEVRRDLRAWSLWGSTLGAVPSARKLRALHDQALTAVLRTPADEDARSTARDRSPGLPARAPTRRHGVNTERVGP